MALVALLRGANLGTKRFSPVAVAKELEDLRVASIGAAGTFVVRARVSESALRARLSAALPFECEIIVLPERELRAAVAAGERLDLPEGAKRFATALLRAPSPAASVPAMPLVAPEGAAWGVRVERLEGRVALGVRRRLDQGGVYPNEVVEKAFGQPATTRDWPTMEKILAALDA